MKKLLLIFLMLFSLTSFADTQEDVAKMIFNPLNLNQVRTPITMDVPLIFDDDHQDQWNVIENALRSAKSVDFTFRVMGIGGDALKLQEFTRDIQEAQQNGNTVTMVIIGPAASAHAYMTCYANKVILLSGSSLLFHQAGGEVSLFYGLIRYRAITDQDMVLNIANDMFNTCLTRKRLTQKDIDVINSGDDVVFLQIGDKLIKEYRSDDGSFFRYTLPLFLSKVSDILAILSILGLIVYIIRRAGK